MRELVAKVKVGTVGRDTHEPAHVRQLSAGDVVQRELVPEQRRELGDVVVGNRGVARSHPFHKVVQLIRLVAGVPAPGLL